MNLKHYEAVYWIGRLGSFRAAARQLGVSQAAISARVQEAEDSLGVPLFTRAHRAALLTTKGQELLPYAARFLALASEVEQRIGTRETLTGRIRFGVTNIHAHTWLPGLIQQLGRTHPGLSMEVAVDTSETHRTALERGQIDVAVVAGPLDESRLFVTPMGAVSNLWVASPHLNLPARPLGARELASWPVISDRPGTLLHGLMLEWFRAEDAEPQRNHSASHLPTRIHLARHGLGIALAAASSVSAELAAGTLVRVETVNPPPSLSYALACASPIPTPAMRVVIDAAAAQIAQKSDLNRYYDVLAYPQGEENPISDQ